MPKTTFPSLETLRTDFSTIQLSESESFYWSAREQTVHFIPTALQSSAGIYQLFHELGHAVKQHSNYTSGIELIRLETEAWEQAKEIALSYQLTIDNNQIESCLDSYRDWLHLRSTCPKCHSISTEVTPNHYRCFNCSQKWQVPKDQRSRHYRLRLTNGLHVTI